MAYDNPTYLLLNGSVSEGGRRVFARTTQVGDLTVVSGAVCGYDPFAFWAPKAKFAAPNGRHPVFVTVADLSESGDGSHLREAYLSVVFASSPIARVDTATPIGGEPPGEGKACGVAVDSAIAAFADASAAEFTYEDDNEAFCDIWIDHLDDPTHSFDGVDVVNVEIPGGSPQTNIVFCHSGWGDGFYPIIQSYDADGNVNGIHIDFQVFD